MKNRVRCQTRWPLSLSKREQLAVTDLDFVAAIRRIIREGTVEGPCDWEGRLGLRRIQRTANNVLADIRAQQREHGE